MILDELPQPTPTDPVGTAYLSPDGTVYRLKHYTNSDSTPAYAVLRRDGLTTYTQTLPDGARTLTPLIRRSMPWTPDPQPR